MRKVERVTFTDDDKRIARELLKACPIPRDRLPYTPEFDQLHARFCGITDRVMAPHTFWRLLSSAAKQGGLSKRVPSDS